MRKLYAIADLHLSFPANREALAALHPRAYADCGLILAGDLGEKLEHLRWAFEWATSHFGAGVWWCPGNHELFTLPGEPSKAELEEARRNGAEGQEGAAAERAERAEKKLREERGLKGEERYMACVEVARSYGVLTPEDPFQVFEFDEEEDDGREPQTSSYTTTTSSSDAHQQGNETKRRKGRRRKRAVICPIFTLYDYSFRPDGVTREAAVDWALEQNVQATDEVLLHPDPYPTRDAWCERLVAKFARKLQDAAELHNSSQGGGRGGEGGGEEGQEEEEDVPLVIANHWPLTEKVCYLPAIPRFSLWCGTRRTADWHKGHFLSSPSLSSSLPPSSSSSSSAPAPTAAARVAAVVSGHLHIRRTDWVDGVRFEECSLGYPRQWEGARRAGRDVNDFLREILPSPWGSAPLRDRDVTAAALGRAVEYENASQAARDGVARARAAGADEGRTIWRMYGGN